MKVLVWGEYFLPFLGGAEVFLSQLIPALQKRSVQFQAIVTRHDPRLQGLEIWNDMPLHRLDFHQAIRGDLGVFSEIKGKLRNIYKDFSPDLIHINTTGPSLFFELQTHPLFHIPRFLTVHAFFSYPPGKDGYFLKHLPKVDFLSAVSEKMLEMAKKLFQEKTPPNRIIYNGVIPPSRSPEALSDHGEIVLSLGRLSKVKGVDLGILAFHRISATHPQARLWIAGEGAEINALMDLTKFLGIQDRVRFLGPIPPEEVYNIIRQARFLIMPSRFDEGLPLTALQAAHLSKPVIGVRRGGLPEFVRNEETGLLVEEEDWQGLATAMERLLDDPGLCLALGERARELAKTQFDFTAMVDAYERIYRQLAPGK